MGAADRRRALLERHRELVSRHEILDRADPDSDRHEDLFLRVVDATDDLIHDLDQARQRAAARRRAVAFTLATAVPAALGLVAAGTVPSLWLAGAAVVAAAAAVLWLTSRPAQPEPAAPPLPPDNAAPQPSPRHVRAGSAAPPSTQDRRPPTAGPTPPVEGAVLA